MIMNPNFLIIYFTLSKRGMLFSLSAISVLSHASSSSRSATVDSGASFSEGEAFLSLITALSSSFWRSSSGSFSLRSSSSFVLLKLSSSVFISFSMEARFLLSLWTYFVISLSVLVAFVRHQVKSSQATLFKLGKNIGHITNIKF